MISREKLTKRSYCRELTGKAQLELDPQVNEKRKLFCEILEGNPSQEECEAKGQNSAGLMADLLYVSKAESFVDLVLEQIKSRSVKR